MRWVSTTDFSNHRRASESVRLVNIMPSSITNLSHHFSAAILENKLWQFFFFFDRLTLAADLALLVASMETCFVKHSLYFHPVEWRVKHHDPAFCSPRLYFPAPAVEMFDPKYYPRIFKCFSVVNGFLACLEPWKWWWYRPGAEPGISVGGVKNIFSI